MVFLKYAHHFMWRLKRLYWNYREKEHKLVFGKKSDKDKQFYLIRCDLPDCGFFALITFVLDHLAVAEHRGLIPVVDMENYWNLYKCDEIKEIKNVWDYYFLPVSDYSVMDVRHRRNTILSEIHFPHYKAMYYEKNKNDLPSPQQIAECNRIVRKYIKFNNVVQEYLDEAISILCPFKRVLGIHIRGTDMYTAGNRHPVPTGKTKDIELIRKIMKQHQLDGIFVCTDTESNIDLLKKEFDSSVVFTNSIRQRDGSFVGIHRDSDLKGNRKYHEYMMGLEVLRDMYLLSKCDVLLCGPSNVAFFAMIYNDNMYEKIYYL